MQLYADLALDSSIQGQYNLKKTKTRSNVFDLKIKKKRLEGEHRSNSEKLPTSWHLAGNSTQI